MNFSELFRQSDLLCGYSPNGKYLASCVDYRLVVRDVDTLQIQQLFSCQDAIQYMEWSPDSLFILCGMYKRGIVQVWSLENPEWHCKIDEGSAGLKAVRWSPDSRHVLTTADFHLRITVWSLTNKSVSYIRHPKKCEKGVDFTKDGKYMALAERRDCKDYVSIFSCDGWSLVKHFESETEDLSGLEWSPDSRVLCVRDSCLYYKIVMYALDGRMLGSYSAYDSALGVKTVAWSPSSQLLLIGSFDEKIRILGHVTWKKIFTFTHPNPAQGNNLVVYREVTHSTKSKPEPPPASSLFTGQSRYELQPCPVSIPTEDPPSRKANPKKGVSKVAFSANNKYFCSINDNMPKVLWIWNVSHLELCAVLIQDLAISCVSWDPQKPRLALCTGTNKLYMWSPEGCLCVDVPAEASFKVRQVHWQPDGGSLLLMGHKQMCVCYLTSPPATSDPNATHTTAQSTITTVHNNNDTTTLTMQTNDPSPC
ncbi:WD repeat-containing protein WRAP73-like [Babylonia areolata]|uniref:WD repeat-containing protein WRAP73-like n=1 Tax=Babylonia areolata TaxID=304850 RepID=UPI003FCF0B29